MEGLESHGEPQPPSLRTIVNMAGPGDSWNALLCLSGYRSRKRSLVHALYGGGTEQIQTGFTQAKALFLQDRRVVMALRTPFLPSLNEPPYFLSQAVQDSGKQRLPSETRKPMYYLEAIWTVAHSADPQKLTHAGVTQFTKYVRINHGPCSCPCF